MSPPFSSPWHSFWRPRDPSPPLSITRRSHHPRHAQMSPPPHAHLVQKVCDEGILLRHTRGRKVSPDGAGQLLARLALFVAAACAAAAGGTALAYAAHRGDGRGGRPSRCYRVGA